MSMQAFQPRFMKIGVLTAAFQELTPRQVRDADPDRAIEDWAVFAREVGADFMQLSAALHPSEADVPPEAMLDPVANTLDLRQPFDEQRSRRVRAALESTGVGLSDLGYFDNMLHESPAIRRKKHDFMRRVMDAAVLLGVGFLLDGVSYLSTGIRQSLGGIGLGVVVYVGVSALLRSDELRRVYRLGAKTGAAVRGDRTG